MTRTTGIFSRIGRLLRSREIAAPQRPHDEEPPVSGPFAAPSRGVDLAAERASGHAPGHRHLGPPPEVPRPRGTVPAQPARHQAWQGQGGRVGRLRRNERHGDEKPS